jgi:hypothetical protein
MSKKKVSVRQQQFGFPDEDLKTSLHDEIVLWLKQNSRVISQRIFDWDVNWDPRLVEAQRKLLTAVVEKCKSDLRAEVEVLANWKRGYQRLEATKEILRSFESWEGLGKPPPARFSVTTKLEVPIIRQRYRTTDIIGYADIVFSISPSVLEAGTVPVDQFGKYRFETNTVGGLKWISFFATPAKVALDAKSTIPSLGELIRCLRTYRTYCDWPFYVVSPEARFAEVISDEGFGFIQYPDGVFLRPRKHD